MSLAREDELHRQIHNKEKKIRALEMENTILKDKARNSVRKEDYDKILVKCAKHEDTITNLYNFILENGLDYNL